MSIRKFSLGLMVAAVLAAGLLLWPTTAAAADRDDENPIRFKPALDFGMGGSGTNPSSLSLRLYGGYARIAAGDLNEGLDMYFELLELYAAAGYGTFIGSYSPLHAGYNFGADLVYQITPTIGIGFGAGYLRSSQSSQASWEYFKVEEISGTATVSAVPIRLGLFFTFPFGGNFHLTANAGAAYYAGLKLDATQRLEDLEETWWFEQGLSANRSSFANMGFHGSLGFEYMFSPKMGFFVEALGRYANFKNFDVATGSYRDSFGNSDSTEGKIYLVSSSYPSLGTWTFFAVSEDPPTPSPPSFTYREPKIDLSGVSLQAGIRIRF